VSDYKWIDIGAPADFDQLLSILDPEFGPLEVVAALKVAIRPKVQGVLIEGDYVDKDYRSTFYRHYAKKGRVYRDDCVRLHLFDAGVTFDKAKTDLRAAEPLDDHYFGYIVLRPTIRATIGRSILSPDIRIGAKGHTIQSRHHVHLLGHKIGFWGFPSMSQHTDISVCAHVSCWSILRHYSERFSQHREWLLYDITTMAAPFDPGGLTPALGLNIAQAERIFQAAGTFPLIVVKESATDERFYAQLLAYLESGFPLFVAMEGQEHAVVATGYSWRKPAQAPPYLNSHAWEQVDSVLTVDDNLLPYVPVARDLVSAAPGGAAAAAPAYTAMDFDAFIVALPEKVFYSALAVERFSKGPLFNFLKSNMPMPKAKDLLRRYFVTTVSALRRFAREKDSQLGDELVNMFMRLQTAQFVWVVEYASAAQWQKGHIAARAIVDATASPHDPVPVWFAHGKEKAFLFDRNHARLKVDAAKIGRPAGTPLSRMEQNLRPIRES
jgi:hypothetical protein